MRSDATFLRRQTGMLVAGQGRRAGVFAEKALFCEPQPPLFKFKGRGLAVRGSAAFPCDS